MSDGTKDGFDELERMTPQVSDDISTEQRLADELGAIFVDRITGDSVDVGSVRDALVALGLVVLTEEEVRLAKQWGDYTKAHAPSLFWKHEDDLLARLSRQEAE